MRDLDALASQARGYLVDKGCARSTIAHHGAAWKRLMSWCEDEGIGGHGHDVGRRFIEEVVMANADATRCLGLDKSRVLLLLSIGETGEPPPIGRQGGDSSSRRASTPPTWPMPQSSRSADSGLPRGRATPAAPATSARAAAPRALDSSTPAPSASSRRRSRTARHRPARPGPASHATSRASWQESGRAVPRLPRQSPISQATSTRPCHPRTLRPRCRRCRGLPALAAPQARPGDDAARIRPRHAGGRHRGPGAVRH